MTDTTNPWLDNEIAALLGDLEVPAGRRPELAREIASHVYEAAAERAHRAGRTTPATSDVQAAFAALGGRQGLAPMFTGPRPLPTRLARRVAGVGVGTWMVGALAGVTAAAVAISRSTNAQPQPWFVAVVALAVASLACVASAVVAILRRPDLSPSTRLPWLALAILVPPVGAVAYFVLGRATTRRLAHRWMGLADPTGI